MFSVDGELDQHPRPVELDGLDLADAGSPRPERRRRSSGRRHRRSTPSTPCPGRTAACRIAARRSRCPTLTKQPDGADDEQIAFTERLHFGAHLPVDWPATLTYTGWPPLPLSFSTMIAQVEAEEVAVDALPRQRLVRVRQGVQQVVEVVVVGHHDARGAVGFVDRLGERRARLRQQIGDASRRRRWCRPRRC